MTAYSEIMDFLTSGPTLEQIVTFRPSEATRKRAYELAKAQQNGTITPEERDELAEFMRAKRFLESIRVRARRRLGIEQVG